MTQREGRLIRRGNLNQEVHVYRYITNDTFDAYIWEILEAKAAFLADFLADDGLLSSRSAQELRDIALTYSEIKSLAHSDPRIKEKLNLFNEYKRTRAAAQARNQELAALGKMLETARREEIAFSEAAIAAELDASKVDRGTVHKDERIALGEELLLALGQPRNEECLFDTYRSVDILLPPQRTDHVLLRGTSGAKYYCAINDVTPLGVCSALDNALFGLHNRAKRCRELLQQTKNNIAATQASIDRGNPYEEKLAILQADIDRLKEELA